MLFVYAPHTLLILTSHPPPAHTSGCHVVDIRYTGQRSSSHYSTPHWEFRGQQTDDVYVTTAGGGFTPSEAVVDTCKSI